MEARRQLMDHLRALFEEGGDGNFLVVEVGAHYVQFAAERGHPEGVMEAVSNAYLDEGAGLGPAQQAQLRLLGFQLDDEDQNYSRPISLEAPEERENLADLTDRVLSQVYGSSLDRASFDLNLGDLWRPENESLLQAIRRSGRLTWDVGTELREAHLLLPVDGEDPVIESLPGGGTAVVLLTDDQAMRAWRDGGANHRVGSGKELFGWLAECGVTHVVLNPEGPGRLELGAGEITLLGS